MHAGAQPAAIARQVAPSELHILVLQYTAEQALRSETGKWSNQTNILTCDTTVNFGLTAPVYLSCRSAIPLQLSHMLFELLTVDH